MHAGRRMPRLARLTRITNRETVFARNRLALRSNLDRPSTLLPSPFVTCFRPLTSGPIQLATYAYRPSADTSNAKVVFWPSVTQKELSQNILDFPLTQRHCTAHEIQRAGPLKSIGVPLPRYC